MRGRNRICCLVLSMVVILILGSVIPSTDLFHDELQFTEKVSEPKGKIAFRAGITHGPITIDGDTDFSITAANEGWPGNGTPENPYIIDGLDIDLGGGVGKCIMIHNTQVSFIISNCTLTGASEREDSWDGIGIFLEDVTHGKLVNNILDGNCFSILFFDSNYTIITNNTLTNNIFDGIIFYGSSHNTVVNNTFYSNNDRGIDIRLDSTSNTLVDNTCYNNGYGIYISNSEFNTVVNNTCTSNNIHGIGLWNSNYSTVNDNTCTNNEHGISISNSDSNTVTSNTCNNNTEHGISISYSDFNTVTGNTCNNNRIGIYLYESYSNTVENNTCLGNTEHDIAEEFETVVSVEFVIGLVIFAVLVVGWILYKRR